VGPDVTSAYPKTRSQSANEWKSRQACQQCLPYEALYFQLAEPDHTRPLNIAYLRKYLSPRNGRLTDSYFVCPETPPPLTYRTVCFTDKYADKASVSDPFFEILIRSLPMAMIGYARVSTHDQNMSLQTDALNDASVKRIFKDEGVSGAKQSRPGLDAALGFLRNGDTLVVWRLDRLGRSMKHLLSTVSSLEERGIGFKSLTENIDTTTPTGRLVFHIFGALGEFERDLIRERTQAGLKAAAARGRKGGRPKVMTSDKVDRARSLIEQGLTVREAAQRLKVGKTALYEALRLERL
jgi:DNA invertase Pin-like site-specific DNA recombinase